MVISLVIATLVLGSTAYVSVKAVLPLVRDVNATETRPLEAPPARDASLTRSSALVDYQQQLHSDVEVLPEQGPCFGAPSSADLLPLNIVAWPW
jgi:hypothetical protein